MTATVTEGEIKHTAPPHLVQVKDWVPGSLPVALNKADGFALELRVEEKMQITVGLCQVELVSRLKGFDAPHQRMFRISNRHLVWPDWRMSDEHRAERLHEMRRPVRTVNFA